MESTARAEPGTRRVMAVLFVVLFLTYAYGRQTPSNANTISRAALALGLLQGTVTIDRFQEATPDKAFAAGHYYSDKAPGLSVASLPAVAAAYGLLKAAGKADLSVNAATGDPSPAFKLVTVFATVFTSGLATAAVGAALFWVCRRLGCDPGGALFAALTFGLATPAWGWATAFFGHALAGSCLFLGFAAAVRLLEGPPPARPLLGWCLVGTLLAYAVVVEYPVAIASVLVGLTVLVRAARLGMHTLARALAGMALGALPCAALLMTYNAAAFGSPFRLSYSRVEGFEGMQQGVLGVTYPRWEALYGILTSPRRGIVWLAPVLAFVPFAFLLAWRVRGAWVYLAGALLVVAYFIALNSAYHYWDGGFSTGPRHLTPSLGFACLPLGLLWSGAGRGLRVLLASAWGLSFALCLVCTAVTMTVDPDYANPLAQMLLPAFAAGDVRNLGELFGLRGHLSLLPWLAIWAVGGWQLARALRACRPVGEGAGA